MCQIFKNKTNEGGKIGGGWGGVRPGINFSTNGGGDGRDSLGY